MESLLTEDECVHLFLSLLETRGATGATEEEGYILFSWATEARTSHHLLSLVLSGRIQVDIRDGEVIFSKDFSKERRP